MPLRDRFRSPLDDERWWDELHGLWPGGIVRQLASLLPKGGYAGPGIHLGTLFEVDVSTYEDTIATDVVSADVDNSGSMAVATWAPPKPTQITEWRLRGQDVHEVRIYDERRSRRLVAAIEIVSPSNKDRPDRCAAFVAKTASLLQQHVCVSIVDMVSTRRFNLFAELMACNEDVDPSTVDEHVPIYAATIRRRREENRRLLDS